MLKCIPAARRARTDANRSDDGSLRGSARARKQCVSTSAHWRVVSSSCAARLVGVDLVGCARQVKAAASCDVLAEAQDFGASHRGQLANAPVKRRALHGAAAGAVHRQRHRVGRARKQAARERLDSRCRERGRVSSCSARAAAAALQPARTVCSMLSHRSMLRLPTRPAPIMPRNATTATTLRDGCRSHCSSMARATRLY